MIPMKTINRRRMLRGMMGGAAIGVGLPLLDCFLDVNGEALADGSPLPICFGTFFAGLGFNPGRWEPKIVGPKYDMAPELEVLTPFKDKINIYTGLKAFLDGHPLTVHNTGTQVCINGGIPRGGETLAPSLDSLIADVIGTRTRFRSLEAACSGFPQSFSRRGAAMNPPELSPAALYTRIFGADFRDPNAADFTPDPRVMVKKSVLSAVAQHRQEFLSQVGAADRARLDEYFTVLRDLEQQLSLQLQKPAPLEACTTPAKAPDATVGAIVEDVHSNNKLFSGLLAHALACDQTRVVNLVFTPALSNLRKAASPLTFHMYTHEESYDPKLGYQPESTWFMMQSAVGFHDFLAALDGIREGERTLLDRMAVYFSSDTGYARVHGLDSMPLMSAGRAGGRLKTGIHFHAPNEPATRVGLTLQQAMGVPVGSWGTESNQTSKTIAEVVG